MQSLIFRSKKQEDTLVPSYALSDNRLSLSAKGLYSILWLESEMSVDKLKSLSFSGSVEFNSALNELIQLGYITAKNGYAVNIKPIVKSKTWVTAEIQKRGYSNKLAQLLEVYFSARASKKGKFSDVGYDLRHNDVVNLLDKLDSLEHKNQVVERAIREGKAHFDKIVSKVVEVNEEEVIAESF